MDNNENFAMFEEINEELKQDQMAAFIRRNYRAIVGVLITVVLGIIIYSTWHERQKRKMEDVTNALLTVVQNPSEKDDLMLGKLLEAAPAELRPILMIMKSGKKLMIGEGNSDEVLQPLLNLANRSGVDIVWKDLASLIYASYSTKPSDELLKILEPLTQAKRPFRFSAIELVAMIHANEGRTKEALEYLEKITNSTEAPKSMKDRIGILVQYMKNENANHEGEK